MFIINRNLKKTQLKLQKANDELTQANELKSQMLSIVAHDIRSPVSNLIGMTKILREECTHASEAELQLLDKLIDQGASTLSAVDDLLRWAKSTTSMNSLLKEPVNLHELLEKELSLLKENADQKGIEFHRVYEAQGHIISDPQAISFVIRNLLNNAVKFSHNHSTVEVGIENDHVGTTLYCKDYGVGMSPNQIEQLFNQKQNQSKPGTNNELGFGFGLPMAQQYMQKMGGAIEVESTLGEGSTFKAVFSKQ